MARAMCIIGIAMNARRAYLRQELPSGSTTELEARAAEEVPVDDQAHRQQVLEGLSEAERSIYVGFRDGLSVREIARQLKVGVPSVKAFKKRLRKQLKIDPIVPGWLPPLVHLPWSSRAWSALYFLISLESRDSIPFAP